MSCENKIKHNYLIVKYSSIFFSWNNNNYCYINFFVTELLTNGKHPKGLIAVLKDIPDLEADDSKLTALAHKRLKRIQKKLADLLPETHVVRLE